MKKLFFILTLSFYSNLFAQTNAEIIKYISNKLEVHDEYENITFSIKNCNLIIKYDQFKQDPEEPFYDPKVVVYTIPISEIDTDAINWKFIKYSYGTALEAYCKLLKGSKNFKREITPYSTGITETEYVNSWILSYQYPTDISPKLNSYFKKLVENCSK
ncbi:MAG: hypothetical protein IPK18_09925 [Sphingobacteriales bacterium]|nr:MAG: hypothetical protein IPK18_09925 [Sphingobacteriales bacterium]